MQVLSGSIASQEDHGYVVDLGVKGVNAFLKNKEADQYIAEYNEGGTCWSYCLSLN